MSNECIFRQHFEVNAWGSDESVSGPGSTIVYTENIRKEIPRLVHDLAIQTILDAPCGDYNWFKMIDWREAVTYIGGDIVQPLVERNQSLYESPNTKFIKIDIAHDVLPTADLGSVNILSHIVFSLAGPVSPGNAFIPPGGTPWARVMRRS